MISVLHIIESSASEKAKRAVAALIENASSFDGCQHRLVTLTATDDSSVWSAVQQAGVEVVKAPEHEDLLRLWEPADIVELKWWNSPSMHDLLHGQLPPARLISWFLMAGDQDPHFVSGEMIDFVDFAVVAGHPGSSYPGIQELPAEERLAKTWEWDAGSSDHKGSAGQVSALYQRLLQMPKQSRQWGFNPHKSVLVQETALQDVGVLKRHHHGAECLMESLYQQRDLFKTSKSSKDVSELLQVEQQIASCNLEMYEVLRAYRLYFPDDPLLQLWHGLAAFGTRSFDLAIAEFASALRLQLPRPYVFWYIAQAASQAGNPILAKESLDTICAVWPQFRPAQEFRENLAKGRVPSSESSLNSLIW